VPDYHPMGSAGMADMGSMEMAMPNNTLPMMTGFGQFGPIEMGGMFTVMKIRADLASNDYRDPGPYRHPEGTVAYEFKGTVEQPPRSDNPAPGRPAVERAAVKPGRKGTSVPRR
jgi:manganese oxidase